MSLLSDIFKQVKDARDKERNPLIGVVYYQPIGNPEHHVGQYFSPNDSSAISKATYALIKAAKSSVCMQFYKFNSNTDLAHDIFTALQELGKEVSSSGENPITVKILVNHRVGLAAKVTKTYENPKPQILNALGTLPGLAVEVRIHEHSGFDAHHTKQIIVDNKLGMLRSGDIAPDMNYTDGTNSSRYENATIVAGSIAEGMLLDFNQAWSSVDPDKGQTNYPFISWKIETAAEEDKAKDSVLLLTKHESGDITRRYTAPAKIAMLAAIKKAKTSIQIITPNLNDPDIVYELIAACNRDVRVEIIMGICHNDSEESKPTMGGTNRAIAKLMYEHVSESKRNNLEIRWARDQEGKLAIAKYEKALHAKAAIFDGKYVLTGTSPLDVQSMHHSREADFFFKSQTIALACRKLVFEPAFNLGIEYNAEKLLTIKETVISSIRKTVHEPLKAVKYPGFISNAIISRVPDALSWKKSDFADITSEKITAIKNLIIEIDNARFIVEIEGLIDKYTIIEPSNPLARYRYRFKDATYGVTSTIEKLLDIKKTHLHSIEDDSEIRNAVDGNPQLKSMFSP